MCVYWRLLRICDKPISILWTLKILQSKNLDNPCSWADMRTATPDLYIAHYVRVSLLCQSARLLMILILWRKKYLLNMTKSKHKTDFPNLQINIQFCLLFTCMYARINMAFWHLQIILNISFRKDLHANGRCSRSLYTTPASRQSRTDWFISKMVIDCQDDGLMYAYQKCCSFAN